MPFLYCHLQKYPQHKTDAVLWDFTGLKSLECALHGTFNVNVTVATLLPKLAKPVALGSFKLSISDGIETTRIVALISSGFLLSSLLTLSSGLQGYAFSFPSQPMEIRHANRAIHLIPLLDMLAPFLVQRGVKLLQLSLHSPLRRLDAVFLSAS